MQKNDQYRQTGVITTIIFHVLLILLFVYYGFTTPLPLPAEQGIMVNFGNDLQGFGNEEPRFSEPSKPVVDQQSQPEEEKVEEKGKLTQDFEEAPAIKAPDKKETKKKTEKPVVKAKETTKTATKPEPVKEERKPNPLALYKGRGSETSTSTNEGIAGGQGNQGNPTGSPDSKNYSNIESTGGNGVSYNLSGRSHLNLPKPYYNCQTEGTVVVEVTVDQKGNVTQAVPGVKGSTELDKCLLDAAKQAALLAKFNTKTNAPAYQKGTITYRFKLQ